MLQADGNEVLLDTKQLYAKAARRKWRKVAGLPWRVVSCTVQLNFEEDESKPERWQPVKLLFVRDLDFVMQAIDREVEQFLERSLQLDVLSLQMEDGPAVLSGQFR